MGGQKKNGGCGSCLVSLIVISLVIKVFSLVVSHIKQILTVVLYGVLAILVLLCVMAILETIKKKYAEKDNIEMTLVQKFLDKLKMGNQGQKGEVNAEEISIIEIPIAETEKALEEIINEEEIVDIQRKDKTEITVDEVIESFKKQYYIVDENKVDEIVDDLCPDSVNVNPIEDFKMESTRDKENSTARSNNHKEMSVSEALSELNRANRLADIANKTTDREEFYNSIDEIEKILMELTKYEHKFDFSYPPSANLRDLRRERDKQIELLEKKIEEKEKETYKSTINKEHVKDETKPVKRELKPKYTYMSQYEIEKYARECNAYVQREERKEQKEQKNDKNEESSEKNDSAQIQYKYVLFSESINTDTIIGFRSDYMRSDYTIEPIFYESHQYIYNVWKLSKDLEKVIKAKNFFESLEEIEKALEIIEKYNYPKFNPEKEKEYFYSQKDEVLINFLNRSFMDEYRSSLELKTAKGKINRLGNWFSVIDYYKKDFNPNVLEAFECLVDKWQFEILPSILEPENKKEI